MMRILLASTLTLVLTGLCQAQSGTRYIPAPPPPTSVLLTVKLPAEASLTIDGARTSQTGSERQFISPPLPEGKVFVYTLKATWTADGKKMEREKKVEVKAGARINVDLNKAEEKEK